jgi:hypothetical protein
VSGFAFYALVRLVADCAAICLDQRIDAVLWSCGFAHPCMTLRALVMGLNNDLVYSFEVPKAVSWLIDRRLARSRERRRYTQCNVLMQREPLERIGSRQRAA